MKPVVRVKISELKKLQGNMLDSQFAKKIGVAQSTLYRVKLDPHDKRHSVPGEAFIAGILSTFPSIKFEDVFFLDNDLQGCKKESAACGRNTNSA